MTLTEETTRTLAVPGATLTYDVRPGGPPGSPARFTGGYTWRPPGLAEHVVRSSTLSSSNPIGRMAYKGRPARTLQRHGTSEIPCQCKRSWRRARGDSNTEPPDP